MDFLERIRSKSPQSRAWYTTLFAGGLTGLVALVWLTTLPSQFKETAIQLKAERPTSVLSDVLSDTKAQMANTVESIQPDPKEEVVERQNMEALSDPDPIAVPVSTTTPPVETLKAPEPKVILIGTTTARSSE